MTWRLTKNQPTLHPEERTLGADAIEHFDGRRYDVFAYVVMDDHVHVLVFPLAGHALKQIVHSWKSFTANELRKLRERGVPVWQDEYFDGIIRNEAELARKTKYILGNPVKRWPETNEYPWAWPQVHGYCAAEPGD